MPKTGKIPLKDFFDAIYETVDSQEIRETAPKELRELKLSLKNALKQIDLIANKMKRPKQSR